MAKVLVFDHPPPNTLPDIYFLPKISIKFFTMWENYTKTPLSTPYLVWVSQSKICSIFFLAEEERRFNHQLWLWPYSFSVFYGHIIKSVHLPCLHGSHNWLITVWKWFITKKPWTTWKKKTKQTIYGTPLWQAELATKCLYSSVALSTEAQDQFNTSCLAIKYYIINKVI